MDYNFNGGAGVIPVRGGTATRRLFRGRMDLGPLIQKKLAANEEVMAKRVAASNALKERALGQNHATRAQVGRSGPGGVWMNADFAKDTDASAFMAYAKSVEDVSRVELVRNRDHETKVLTFNVTVSFRLRS